MTWLRCPVCAATLRIEAATLRCARGHAFDIARHGYVHLAPGLRSHRADTAAMVAARERFLSAGHFDAIIDATARAAIDPWGRSPATQRGCVVDVGAGTGHYLSAVLRQSPGWDGIAIDISRPAARRAARAHPRMGAVIADAWGRLPIADGVVDAVLSVFAPRGADEMARVLRPGGVLVVVTPTPAHLHELVAAFSLISVDPEKESRLARRLAAAFVLEDQRTLRWTMMFDRATIADAVGMGPNAWHVPAAALEPRLARLPAPSEITLSVRVRTYRPRARGCSNCGGTWAADADAAETGSPRVRRLSRNNLLDLELWEPDWL